MSIEWIRLPIGLLEEAKGLSLTDIAVAAVIVDECEEGEKRLSAAEIAKKLSLSSRTVARSLEKLEAEGLISSRKISGSASLYKHSGILPPKKRTQQADAERAELQTRRRRKELQALRAEQDGEGLEKYEQVINHIPVPESPEPEPPIFSPAPTPEPEQEPQSIQDIKFTDPALKAIQDKLLAKKGK